MVKRVTRQDRERRPSLQATLTALQSLPDERIPYSAIFYGLSDLTEEQADQVKSVWESVAPTHRQRILRQMAELSETDFAMDYHAVGLMSLDAADADVRASAIEVLWDDETPELMARLINMSQQDAAPAVRAAAASALSRFIYLGEVGDFPETKAVAAQNAVIALWSNPDEPVDVRRRALEALANCSHPMVLGAIKEAYASPDPMMRVSALFAMGRTYDPRWAEVILREIDSDIPEIRYEAARAAGELELAAAVPRLARLAASRDAEIQQIAIWSLGEIGSEEAVRILETLAETAEATDNEELLEAIDDAIANASLVLGALPYIFDPHGEFGDVEQDD